MVNFVFSEETDEIGCIWRWRWSPKLMLRLMAPRNPESDKENGLDFSHGSIYAISQVNPWMELNHAL